MSTTVPTINTRARLASTSTIPAIREPAWAQTARFAARPDLFMERYHQRFGDVFRAQIRGFGTGRNVFVADHRMIEQVFKGRPAALHLGEMAGIAVEPIAGPTALLNLDEDAHLKRRKIVLPPFHGERMLKYTSITAEAADRSLRTWPTDQPFAMRPHMANITTEVVMRAVFGVEDGQRRHELSDAVLNLIGTDLLGTLTLTFPQLRRNFGASRGWTKIQRNKEIADRLVFEEIRARRSAPDLADREDILSMLLQTELSDEDIHDNLIEMLVAGHETTATALSWAFDLILHEPAVFRRLQDELAAGDESYLTAVVQEVLRLRPVVVTAQRVVRQPIELGRYQVDPGITLFCSIWMVNRRPDLYEDPLRFHPERFLDTRPGTYEWIPFGGGVRRCIGANFAPMEMRTVIKHVLTHATLEPASPDLEKPRNKVVLMAPKNGTMVIRRGRS